MKYLALILLSTMLNACAIMPQRSSDPAPPERPAELEEYYNYSSGYHSFTKEILEETSSYNKIRYRLATELGEIRIDYYKRNELTDKTIVVFPVLGGRYFFTRHFSRQFARRGYNAALIKRYSAFKKTENFDRLESILQANVIRDRIAISFLQNELGAKSLGSFGISRGAINAASTAGVDKRLLCNVFALGGSDIPDIYRRTSVGRFQRYRETVIKDNNISEDEYYRLLEERIKTDPQELARYIDPKKTLLILAMLDSSVPFYNGRMLRRELHYPKTIFLFADHFSALLTIQFLDMLVPWANFGIIPFDYIESESMDFYNSCFGQPRGWLNTLKLMPIHLLQIPLNVLGNLLDLLT